MIQDFYNTDFTVYRMTWENDSAGLEDVDTFCGHMQQASAILTQQLGLVLTKTFTVWCDTSIDVNDGDTLQTDDYTYYLVRGVQINTYGRNKHKELIVEKQ